MSLHVKQESKGGGSKKGGKTESQTCPILAMKLLLVLVWMVCVLSVCGAMMMTSPVAPNLALPPHLRELHYQVRLLQESSSSAATAPPSTTTTMTAAEAEEEELRRYVQQLFEAFAYAMTFTVGLTGILCYTWLRLRPWRMQLSLFSSKHKHFVLPTRRSIFPVQQQQQPSKDENKPSPPVVVMVPCSPNREASDNNNSLVFSPPHTPRDSAIYEAEVMV